MRRDLLRWMQGRVPQLAPLLADLGSFRQHEGSSGYIARSPGDGDKLNYPLTALSLEVSRDEMRVLDLKGLFAKLNKMAVDLASVQTKMLLQTASDAATAVGNTVSAGGDFQQQHFLEMLRKVEMDFDSETGEPTGQVFVVHPDALASMTAKFESWQKDPEFVEQRERLISEKREEWRARESRRQLVD